MKKSLLVATALLAGLSPVHALVGVGVSGGLNTTSIDAKTDSLTGAEVPYFGQTATLRLSREKVDNLTQIGVKAWLELPLLPIEFEAASNLAWGSYKSSLLYQNGTNPQVSIPVDVPSPLAGFGEDEGSTPYASLLTDLTIRYPLLKLPPVLNTLKIYVGAGVTHVMATRIIDKDDLQSTFKGAEGTFDANKPEVATAIVKDELLQSTFGGHLSAGAQVKIPVLPIALFVDGKWYLNAAVSDAANKYPFTVNAGIGFAL